MVVNQRGPEILVLVTEVVYRIQRFRSFGYAEPLAHGTGDDVPHNHFYRNDFHFAAKLVALPERSYEMRPDSGRLQLLVNDCGNLIVDYAFIRDIGYLDFIVCGSRILVMHDYLVRFTALEYLFRFAFY